MRKADRWKTDIASQEREGEAAPERGRPVAAFCIILVLTGVVGWFWMARDPDARRTVAEGVERTGTTLRNLVSAVWPGTVRNDAHRSPSSGTDPASGTSTLGEGIQVGPGDAFPVFSFGTDGEAAEHTAPGTAEAGEKPFPDGAVQRGIVAGVEADAPSPDKGRQDDAVVRVAFIEDLAAWLVAGYQPSANGTGRLALNLQAANLRYGAGMRGLEGIDGDPHEKRAEILNYVFTPGMLTALYKLYIDRFMDSVERAGEAPRADGGRLTADQRAAMYTLYAARFRGLSGALQGSVALSDLGERIDGLREAARRVVAANSRYAELISAFDAARERGDGTRAAELRRQADAAAQSYRQSVLNRELAAADLVRGVRNNPEARNLDDGTLLYIASWVDRRLRRQPQAADAALQGATLFLELARRFEQKAGHTGE